ncbi:MAG: ATP-grasp domain-containing protein [Planctomycetia bacterium]
MDACSARLVVIGASCRAFAASAAAAGWRVHAADLFGDLDLDAVTAASVRVRDMPGGYPAALVDAVRSFPPAPVCYVGAVENHPEVIRAIAADRRLLGSPPEALAAVRDPWSLRELVRTVGLDFPDLRRSPDGLPTDGSYLRKPLAGAGGRGIVPWDSAADAAAVACHWQRRVVGEAWSAAYVTSAGGGRLIGASLQLTGRPWCHARPFAYCGSVDVPLAMVPGRLRDRLAALAPALAGCGLRGVVGVDFLVDAAGTPWVVEVNPRPTASMELLERASGESIAAAHVSACGGRPPSAGATPGSAGLRQAKAVIYAPRQLRVDEAAVTRLLGLRTLWSAAADRPAIADIPRPEGCIPAGGPICTVFAAAPAAPAAVAELQRRAAAIAAAFSLPAGAAPRSAATPGSIP